ncbi:similar to Saccharomyces cerevisiae YHR105W YPT35 Endosomal protein of unknown function [Maudiozyma barnettii]|uniref:Endosomal/vacuolar adapter protein YPT35 n=1 Tax=Maudiozyma barnettii TaxID=61262 RepID=A0A8H2VB47_9SACH|nr:Ypt35p [Kazachstania barnettii]CAB4252022.1 similar to Saccharomyces cerevisiae YHR105W YPT35 Endosomal protein of unknown function [Kazachstania barnettii]CAD1778461.1 similar to Saccharomyces cerevisiae YHR105W YPT35 Endosomal protein of unknown function [Kazachstania barnettii]
MSTQNRIKILAPEPITLLQNEENDTPHMPTLPGIPTRKHRACSSVNDNFNFSKVSVTDCTILKGDNTSKFAMWKITIILQPSETLIERTNKPQVAYPKVQTYKRYSDFVTFRNIIINKIVTNGETSENILLLSKIPKLPPKIPWYEIWQYQKANYNKKWLIERRIGLEIFLNGIVLNQDVVQICRSEILRFLEEPSPE